LHDRPRSGSIAAFYATYFAVLGLVLPFLGPYLQENRLSAVAVGLITAAFSMARLLYTPFISMLVDRGHIFRGLLTIHLLLAVLAAAALATGLTPLMIAVAFLLIGLGYGTVLPVVEAAVLEQVSGSTYGRLRLFGSVGFIVTAVLAGQLLSHESLHLFPLLLAAILILLAVCCWPFERSAHPASTGADADRRIDWQVWALLVVLTLHQVAHGPYYAFFSIHLEESGYSHSSIAFMWSLGVIVETAAFAGGGLLQGRLGLRRMLRLALLLTPLRWLLLAAPLSLPLLVLVQSGHAVTFAMAHLAGVQLVQRLVRPGSRRLAQSLYSGLSFGLGMVVGTASAGLCYSRCGGSTSFALAGLLSVLVLLLWLPLHRHLGNATGTGTGMGTGSL
jgi:PPP family 3-phenylpropionic acid transporter